MQLHMTSHTYMHSMILSFMLPTKRTHDATGLEEEDDITWAEVCRNCFVHTPAQWAKIALNLTGVLFCLYWFIFSLELLGTGAKVLTGCAAAGLFGGNTNPVASLIVGILVTVMLQSSSTTTSIIVALVGAGSIPVEPAIFMVMGANIGTYVLCLFCLHHPIACSTTIITTCSLHHRLFPHFGIY